MTLTRSNVSRRHWWKHVVALGFTAAVTSRSLRAAGVNYTVPGIVTTLKQPTPNVCWATAATIMSSWKQNATLPIASVMSQADAATQGAFAFAKLFANDKGLAGSLKPDLLRALGLKAEGPMNPTIDGWASLLKSNGLLWVTTNEGVGTGPFFSAHARLMIGIAGDGSPDGTLLTFVDPAIGGKTSETVTKFVKKFEEVAKVDHGAGADLRPQIVHF